MTVDGRTEGTVGNVLHEVTIIGTDQEHKSLNNLYEAYLSVQRLFYMIY